MLESRIVVMNLKKYIHLRPSLGKSSRAQMGIIQIVFCCFHRYACILHQCLFVVETFIVFLDRVLYFSYFLSLFWDSRCPGLSRELQVGCAELRSLGHMADMAVKSWAGDVPGYSCGPKIVRVTDL